MACPDCGRPLSFILEESDYGVEELMLAEELHLHLPVTFKAKLQCEQCGDFYALFSIGKGRKM
jgi:uncharacterized protein YbaR (Trm112 family)